MLDWYRQGKLHVEIDSILPLKDAVAGIQRLMSRQAIGKVILRP